MQKTFKKVRVKHKYDTEANWTSKNPVLMLGELIFVSTADGVRSKLGDGTSTFSTLPFTDELTRTFVAGNYVTKAEFEETVNMLNWGFVATEEEMNVQGSYITALNETFSARLEGGE